MRKSFAILSLGALVLASCSNEELIKPVGPQANGTQQPIGFVQKVNNMGRADGLEAESVDFGVWALKSDYQAHLTYTTGTKAENLVMDNYLVGYYCNDGGYVPAWSQNDHGTGTGYNWYYQGLGSDDSGFTWQDFGDWTGYTAATSANANQYLKYWDRGVAYHYFYAYAPYSANVTYSLADLNDDSAVEGALQFEAISGGYTTLNADKSITLTEPAHNLMYAGRCQASSGHELVPLSFRRLMSKIRVAFYETVPGYTIELADLNEAVPGCAFAPTHLEGGVYSQGSYLTGAAPLVYFTEDSHVLTSHVTYTGTKTTYTEPIYLHKNWLKVNNAGGWTNLVASAEVGKSYGPVLNVLPADAKVANDGFTLNVTLKFTAEDTGEVFYVYGARVYVPADKCVWDGNCLYTYVFKITPKVNGDTGNPNPAIGYGPNPNQALWPIIFEDVTVEDYNDNEIAYEYPIEY